MGPGKVPIPKGLRQPISAQAPDSDEDINFVAKTST